ncbi:hypothetical protein Plhal304r1_c051g0134461 [Plasmopara halstedii]
MDFSQLPPEHNLLLETVGGVDPTPVGEDERKDSCLEEIASAFEKNDQVRAAIRAILGKKDWRPAIKVRIKLTQQMDVGPTWPSLESNDSCVGDHSSGPQEIQVPVEPLLTDFNHLIDDEGRQDRLFQDFQAQAKASRYLRKRTRKSRRGIRRKEMTFGLHTQNVQGMQNTMKPIGKCFEDLRQTSIAGQHSTRKHIRRAKRSRR